MIDVGGGGGGGVCCKLPLLFESKMESTNSDRQTDRQTLLFGVLHLKLYINFAQIVFMCRTLS